MRVRDRVRVRVRVRVRDGGPLVYLVARPPSGEPVAPGEGWGQGQG